MIRTLVLLLPALAICQSPAVAGNGKSLVEPGAEVKKLAGGMKFTEGPVWLPEEKKVVFSDIPNSVMMQWSQADGLSKYRDSKQSNGNILDLQGNIISCQHAGRNVIRINDDGSTTVLADKYEGKRFNSPNDVAIHSDGGVWFTDPSWGLKGPHEIPGHWVYRIAPKTGQVEVMLKSLAMPNGINFSPDDSRVYIADTGGNKQHPDPAYHNLPPSIQCHEVTADGKLGKKLFHIESGSDGMAVDVKGNLYTTFGGKIQVFDADGKKIEDIAVPESPANVCFGGDDFRTLFITARTSLYSVRVKHPGDKPGK